MKPEDVYRLPLVSDPRISPDGTLVAFVVTQADEETNDYTSDIWMVSTDGSQPERRFTWTGKRNAMPRWSPDGRRLAFTSDRDGPGMQLYVTETGEPRKLTDLPEGAASPVWSPDGSRIAFVSAVRGPAYDIEDETQRPPRVITKLDYKADGRGFVQDRQMHVFVIDARDEGEEPVQLTSGDFDHVDPAWSPDGRSLVFCANRDDDRTTHLDLWLIDAGGGEPKQLTASDAMYMKPSWSPDGQTIAARMYPGIETAPWNTQITLTDVQTGNTRVVTQELDMQCGPYSQPREPIWTSETAFVFPVEASGNCHLYRHDGQITALTDGDLVVSDHDVRGGVLVCAVATATNPAELWNEEVRLTSVTSAFRKSVATSDPVRFDAGDVEAWAMPPTDAKPGERYPTLLFIHGGPFAQYGNTFMDEFQVAAGAGYAVVYSNPRGASGYGDEWGRAIRGPISGGPGWGTVDFDDLMAVVDEATRRFDFIDPDRLGVLGGSYGGFMTGWIVTQTERFRAACAERGIYNLFSAIGTSDGLWSSQTYWGGDPYEAPELIMQVSPLTYAEKIRTPLLLLHSDQDHRCPVEQAEQFFTRLRLLGREVEFVRFPHGTHDLSRNGKPHQRVFRFRTILDWFAKHL